MRKLPLGAFVLFSVSVIFTFIYFQATPSFPTPPRPKPNLLTQDQEFINSKYKYKLLYSDIYQINTSNPEVSDQVNFRYKTDETPAQSGITIRIIESKTNLRNLCETNNFESHGILCPQEKITFNPVMDSIPWEIYPKSLIGVVPAGYVYASTHLEGKIYLIINHGYEEIASNMFTTNFTFIK